MNADSAMGCYAMNPDDYDHFNPFFSKVLYEYHKVAPGTKHVNNWDLGSVCNIQHVDRKLRGDRQSARAPCAKPLLASFNAVHSLFIMPPPRSPFFPFLYARRPSPTGSLLAGCEPPEGRQAQRCGPRPPAALDAGADRPKPQGLPAPGCDVAAGSHRHGGQNVQGL